jgi:hypothetical protein
LQSVTDAQGGGMNRSSSRNVRPFEAFDGTAD